MCGILGVRRSWLQARVADPEAAVTAALAALRWRGADGSGVVAAGDWWLGCARLAISGPGRRQPVRSRRSGLLGVLNGAITSAREAWRRDPAGHGRRGRLPNDAWLPVRWVEQGTPLALLDATGHYVAAVLDAARDELRLWRDPDGEKPLLAVTAAGQLVAFASTPAALAALGIGLDWSDAERARLLRFGWCGPPAATEPGLEVHAELAGAFRAAPDLVAVSPPRSAEPETRDLREAVIAAVARCADAAVPVALSLSGGLDSACLAAALGTLGLSPPAWQFRARGEPDQERRLAELAAEAAGLPLRTVDGGAELLDALPGLTRAWGGPLGDPSVLAAHAVARSAAADGARVLLSGEGADELWLGYRRHRAVRWLPRRGWRGLAALAPAWSMDPRGRMLRAAAAAEPYAELLSVTPPGFRRAVLVGELTEGALPDVAGGTGLQRAMAFDRSYLRWDLLPKLDIATMAAGMEGRCPFLDPRLRDLGARAEPRALGKRALRQAFAGLLPAAVQRGRKRGFGLPLDRWIREGALLDLLSERRTLERGHLRKDGLRRAIERHRAGRARVGHGLYLVAALEVHLRCREEAVCGSAAS